jgi:hypothetical protein
MTAHNTPEWIKRLDLSTPAKTTESYPAIVDSDILKGLLKLSDSQLDQLADISGVREHQGVLTPANEWSREQYIEILSDVGEMTVSQPERIRKYLKENL